MTDIWVSDDVSSPYCLYCHGEKYIILEYYSDTIGFEEVCDERQIFLQADPIHYKSACYHYVLFVSSQ